MLRILGSASLVFALNTLHVPTARAQAVTPVPATASASVNTSQQLAPAVAAPLVFENDGSEASHWYGWEILIIDASAITLFSMVAFDPDNREPWFWAGATTGWLGGPIVHAAHGNWGRATGSLGMRIGAPFLGTLIGASMQECSHSCGPNEALLGYAIGAVAAATIDIAVFAHESEEPAPSAVPVVSFNERGGAIGVAGRF